MVLVKLFGAGALWAGYLGCDFCWVVIIGGLWNAIWIVCYVAVVLVAKLKVEIGYIVVILM